MNYELFNMGAYNLHLINTKKFKSITIDVNFRRKIIKDEITIRNLLKDVMLTSNATFKTERDLIKETENLYDLKLLSSVVRIGNDSILSFKSRFLNEKYTEQKISEESIRFLFDIIFNPNVMDNQFNADDINKSKAKLEKAIINIKDNKIKYSLIKLLESVEDRPYSYNSYGYISDLKKINGSNLFDYYKSVINNDLIDIFVVGDFDNHQIKELFREFFKVKTFHRDNFNILVDEIKPVNKIIINKEQDKVNQTQLTALFSLNNLTDNERKYGLMVFNELLGGSSNSLLFENVREKNSYAYYIYSISKPYDNILMIYSGIENDNEDNVIKVIKKVLSIIEKGKFDDVKLNNAKETIIANFKASYDYPNGIINTYLAKILVNSLELEERIENIQKVTREDIIKLAKKIKMHSLFILKGEQKHEKD